MESMRLPYPRSTSTDIHLCNGVNRDFVSNFPGWFESRAYRRGVRYPHRRGRARRAGDAIDGPGATRVDIGEGVLLHDRNTYGMYNRRSDGGDLWSRLAGGEARAVGNERSEAYVDYSMLPANICCDGLRPTT